MAVNLPISSSTKSSPLRSTKIVIPTKSIETQTANSYSSTQNRQNKPFSLEQIQAKWDQFLQKLEADERYGEIVWLKRKFDLDQTTVHLFVDNALQKSMLLEDGVHEELVHFLRNELENSTIRLLVEVSEVVEERKMIYTQAEKYNYLAEKNPNLVLLKTALGLDYDY